VCGTVAYLSPEACITMENNTFGYVGLPADCWSAGVLMFIMLAYVTLLSSFCPLPDGLTAT
jgi:meiosis-specific serine/threonine-protein kinase MEK1